jgi:uncharacterized damage-inducible protein DinB
MRSVFPQHSWTLNHLLLADRLWHGRFAAQPFEIKSLDQELYVDREQLRAAILLQCSLWPDLIAQLATHQLNGDLAFITTEGLARSMPFALTLAHVFNHATHHRGQISAALTMMDHPSPEIDLYFFMLAPKVQRG